MKIILLSSFIISDAWIMDNINLNIFIDMNFLYF